MYKAVRTAICIISALELPACIQQSKESASQSLLANTSDGSDWPGYGRTFDNGHYSPLSEINRKTIDQLGLAWSYDLPPAASTVGAPLAIGGLVYVGTGLSVIRAFDAVSGKLLWEYDPEVGKVGGHELHGAWGIRGIAWWNGKIFAGTMDGRLIAINGATGKPVWSAQSTTKGDGRYITGAPVTFDGKVIIGHGGADFVPIRGYVTTYDAETGKQLWRFYTVPGNPAIDGDETTQLASKTWTGEWWKFGGGGTVWNSITYDSELDRIYLGTGNGFPWNQKIRSPQGGDNLFLCSIVALDAKTGKYLWHYQTTPGESWDYNSSMDIELATLNILGKDTPVILHAPKNGFFYVIDRRDGKLISAEPFTSVNWAKKIDLATGRPIENPEVRQFDKRPVMIKPYGGVGAHGWVPMAYSPKAKLVFLPVINLMGQYDATGIDAKTWKPAPGVVLNIGFNPSVEAGKAPPPSMNFGALTAWDPMAQKARWSVPVREPLNGGVMATAGDLVFQGLANGSFVARDATTGRMLWQFNAQAGILAQPITYRAGGKQYITVVAGFGGGAAAFGPMIAHLGWDYRNQPRRVLTFVLGGRAKLPPPQARTAFNAVPDPAYRVNAKVERQGAALYSISCVNCHGTGAIAGGAAPDLRLSPIITNAESFETIVRSGALSTAGMPRFDNFKAAELEAIRHYLRSQAANARTRH
ncbi:MAG: PQQ-dependent dehydrogenase, methanol/ethanol family [Hyphomicrobiales bacterium]|nr:PQQ-dependent dehydrogenase, methanol/ethanol family [Hyphomicrobiales bacterium]